MELIDLIDPLMTSPLLYLVLTGLCTLDGVLPVIPSEPVLLTAGVFAHAGTPNLLLVVLASALGVFIGDHLAYGLSRSVLGPRLISRSERVSRAAEAAGRQLDRRAGLLILTSRFLPGGRVTMNLACGMAGLPLSRFSPASAIAACAWAAYTAALGFAGGAAFVENPLLGLAVGLGLSFAFGGVIDLIRRRAIRRKVRSKGSVNRSRTTPEPTTTSSIPSASAERQGAPYRPRSALRGQPLLAQVERPQRRRRIRPSHRPAGTMSCLRGASSPRETPL